MQRLLNQVPINSIISLKKKGEKKERREKGRKEEKKGKDTEDTVCQLIKREETSGFHNFAVMNTCLSFMLRNVIPDNMATDCDDRAHIGPAHVDNKIVQEVLRAATGDTLMHAPQLVQKWCKLKVQSPHHGGEYAITPAKGPRKTAGSKRAIKTPAIAKFAVA